MKRYWNGSRLTSIEPENGIEITEEEYDRLICGSHKRLTIAEQDGVVVLLRPNGEVFEGDVATYDPTQEAEYIEEQRVEGIQAQMEELARELTSMDYLDIKEADGEDMTKYGDWRATRRALRARYNELETQI